MLLESYIKSILLNENRNRKKRREYFINKFSKEFIKLIDSYTIEPDDPYSYEASEYEISWEQLDKDMTSLWKRLEEKVRL